MPHRLLVFVVLWLAGPAFAADPLSLWIADFQNLTGDASYDPAGKGVAAILTGRFVRADAVTVVERSRIDAVLSELDLARSGVVDPSTAVRAGRIIGARYVVLGAFATVRLPQLVMTVRVVDTDSGEVVFARDLSYDVGPEGEQFFVMADRIVASIVEGLGVELTERDRRELADVPKVDLRELRGLQAYGGKAPEVAADHPDSLFRDKSRDMLTDGTEGSWTIYDYRGTQYGAGRSPPGSATSARSTRSRPSSRGRAAGGNAARPWACCSGRSASAATGCSP